MRFVPWCSFFKPKAKGAHFYPPRTFILLTSSHPSADLNRCSTSGSASAIPSSSTRPSQSRGVCQVTSSLVGDELQKLRARLWVRASHENMKWSRFSFNQFQHPSFYAPYCFFFGHSLGICDIAKSPIAQPLPCTLCPPFFPFGFPRS